MRSPSPSTPPAAPEAAQTNAQEEIMNKDTKLDPNDPQRIFAGIGVSLSPRQVRKVEERLHDAGATVWEYVAFLRERMTSGKEINNISAYAASDKALAAALPRLREYQLQASCD